MEYPEEIYKTRDGGLLDSYAGPRWGRRHAYEVGHEAGKAERPDPLAGYSDLTAAISAGEPIDYEKLDGLVAKCVHPTLGDLLYTLEVDGNGRKVIWKNEGNFWFTTNGGSVWAEALSSAWYGRDGWSLWIGGEVPLRRKTADELEVGTYFTGQRGGYPPRLMYVSEALSSKVVCYTPNMGKSDFPPSDWEVIEEHGPFQKPEDK